MNEAAPRCLSGGVRRKAAFGRCPQDFVMLDSGAFISVRTLKSPTDAASARNV